MQADENEYVSQPSSGLLLRATRDVTFRSGSDARVRRGDALVLLARAFGEPGRSASSIARLHVEASLPSGDSVTGWVGEGDVEEVRTDDAMSSSVLRIGERVLLRYSSTEAFEAGDFAATLVGVRKGRVVVRFQSGREDEMMAHNLRRKARLGGALDENAPPLPPAPGSLPRQRRVQLPGKRSFRERGLWYYSAAFPWAKGMALRAEPFVLAQRIGTVSFKETFAVDERRTSMQRASPGKRQLPARERFLHLKDGRGWLLERSPDLGTRLLAEVAAPRSETERAGNVAGSSTGGSAGGSAGGAAPPSRFANLLASLIDETERRNPLVEQLVARSPARGDVAGEARAVSPPPSPPPSPPFAPDAVTGGAPLPALPSTGQCSARSAADAPARSFVDSPAPRLPSGFGAPSPISPPEAAPGRSSRPPDVPSELSDEMSSDEETHHALYTAACRWERPICARAHPDVGSAASALSGDAAFWLKPGEVVETDRALVRWLNGHRVTFLRLSEARAAQHLLPRSGARWVFDCDLLTADSSCESLHAHNL